MNLAFGRDVDDFLTARRTAGRLQDALLNASAALDDCEQVGAYVLGLSASDGRGVELQLSTEGARLLLLDPEETRRYDGADGLRSLHHAAQRDGVRYTWVELVPIEQRAEASA